jgi:hypothetical protein
MTAILSGTLVQDWRASGCSTLPIGADTYLGLLRHLAAAAPASGTMMNAVSVSMARIAE